MSTVKNIFPVNGMSCAACSANVEGTLKTVSGVANAGVNLINGTAWVEYNPSECSPTILQKAIRSIGYELEISKETDAISLQQNRALKTQKLLNRTIASAILTLPVFILSMFLMHWQYSNVISWVLSTPIIFWFGRQFYINAWRQLKNLSANMDTLVALSTLTAYLLSVFNTLNPSFWTQKGIHAHVYFESAAVIVTFILFGRWLEERAKNRTSSSIRKLMGLQPQTAMLIEGEKLSEVHISSIVPGNLIMVAPGNRIPADGIVTEGFSFVDESTITGEPIPAEKRIGDKVFAGTSNQKGSLIISAQQVGSETVLSQIIRVVEDAQNTKAPVQKLADKVASVFVPTVLGIAILSLILWFLLGGHQGLLHGILAFATVLAVACPCALGLATPTAITVGIGKASEYGILIKNSENIELANRITHVVMDKTGTLTEGKPRVISWVWDGSASIKEKYLDIIYSMESQSAHPIAQALATFLMGKGANLIDIGTVQNAPGQGITCTYNGNNYFIGSEVYMDTIGISIPGDIDFELPVWSAEGRSVVIFAENKNAIAAFSVDDRLKATSKEAISSLFKMDIMVTMLTGDRIDAAKKIAKELSVENYQAKVLPAQKGAYVKQLQAKGNVVAMVGDGVNDAEALALANVSFAMGKGSDIAMDVAGITLMNSDLRLLSKTINISNKTMRIVKQNLFWAFIFNIIGIPLAAGILYPIIGYQFDPMIAGIAMALSSVSVVSNSLRLRKML